jgi:putative transcriptional regulator
MFAPGLDTLSGKLLIAMPGIGDERFEHSVILVCSHAPDHAMGLVLNRPMTGLSVPGLLDQLEVPFTASLPPLPVLDGGPVGRDRGFVLHSEDFHSSQSTLQVGEGIFLTATREVLHAIASPTPPRQSLLALGYSGWGEGQLEDELADNAWLIADALPEIVFGADHEVKWHRALASLGITPDRLQGQAGHA